MTTLEIKTQGYDEVHPFPDFQEAKPIKLMSANIVQGVVSNGKTGVELFFIDDEGNRYFMATTARMIVNGLSAAVRGAMERFDDDPYKP